MARSPNGLLKTQECGQYSVAGGGLHHRPHSDFVSFFVIRRQRHFACGSSDAVIGRKSEARGAPLQNINRSSPLSPLLVLVLAHITRAVALVLDAREVGEIQERLRASASVMRDGGRGPKDYMPMTDMCSSSTHRARASERCQRHCQKWCLEALVSALYASPLCLARAHLRCARTCGGMVPSEAFGGTAKAPHSPRLPSHALLYYPRLTLAYSSDSIASSTSRQDGGMEQ
ncbi:hypothetical protein C8R44DRAFT_975936 [Mycena epipterygia]|nr:hypothetical protein C8R44DRAFT_975936 [Mycena epipterygia]